MLKISLGDNRHFFYVIQAIFDKVQKDLLKPSKNTGPKDDLSHKVDLSFLGSSQDLKTDIAMIESAKQQLEKKL